MSLVYRKDVLDNGVRVVSESSGDAGSIAIGFWVGVGSSCEPQSLNGISHFIEHILFKGTRRRSAYEIANALESVGGSIDAFAGRETTAFVSRCLPEHLRRSVDVLSDMLCHPAMKDDAIALEKGVIFEEIRNFEDTPEEVVHELLARSVWGSDPIANPILGSMDSVGRLNRRRVLPFFRSFYVSPNTIVSASGRVDHTRLVHYVDKMLKFPRGHKQPALEPYIGGLRRIHHETRKVSQCYICLGTEAAAYVDPRRFATVLLSMVLGGGMTSRLFQEVREKRGLAYSVYCSCEFYKNTGIFVIFLAVDPKKAKRAVAQVSEELRRFKRKGVSSEELKSVKQQLKGNMILGLESTSARMGRLARQEFYLGEYQPVEKSLRRAMRVSRAAVMHEAKRLLDPDRFSLVTVGPTWTIRPTRSQLNF
jgi:predicted Zn-dependent peptidase